MAQGENIVHLEIFDRDGWVCWICSRPVNKRLRYPNWWSATIDHVKPIRYFSDVSQWHRKDNVRTAHLKCNLDKADSILDSPCET